MLWFGTNNRPSKTLYSRGFVGGTVETMVQQKRFWRCHICGDIHFGVKPPEICPTCGFKNAFVLCDRAEAMNVMKDVDYAIDTPEKVVQTWEDLAAKADFHLWDDKQAVSDLSNGVLENVRSNGAKYCPCRITSGEREKDLQLICPCNFKAQKTWKEYGECWCGLFVKR